MIIDHRDYYNHGAIEAIDAIESACSGLQGYEGFLTGTCLKYLSAGAGRAPPSLT